MKNKKAESKRSKSELIEALLEKNEVDPQNATVEDCCSSCCGCGG